MTIVVKVRCLGDHHSARWPNARPGEEKEMTKQEYEILASSDRPGKFEIIGERTDPEHPVVVTKRSKRHG